jgi:cold shock CspA family protein
LECTVVASKANSQKRRVTNIKLVRASVRTTEVGIVQSVKGDFGFLTKKQTVNEVLQSAKAGMAAAADAPVAVQPPKPQSIFFHLSSVVGDSVLKEGDEVQFSLVADGRSKGQPCAVEVTLKNVETGSSRVQLSSDLRARKQKLGMLGEKSTKMAQVRPIFSKKIGTCVLYVNIRC